MSTWRIATVSSVGTDCRYGREDRAGWYRVIGETFPVERSRVLEIKLRLEISRYDLMYVETRTSEGFSIRRRTMACFCEMLEKYFVQKDAFAVKAVIGASTSHRFLIGQVGIGPRSHCLLGVSRNTWDTFSTDTIPKSVKSWTSPREIYGTGEDAVARWLFEWRQPFRRKVVKISCSVLDRSVDVAARISLFVFCQS